MLGEVLTRLSQVIKEIETARGPISRVERAKLDPKAQPFQDLIDDILFRVAGFSEGDVEGLTRRLNEMA